MFDRLPRGRVLARTEKAPGAVDTQRRATNRRIARRTVGFFHIKRRGMGATSQSKLKFEDYDGFVGWITSQNDTAPKPAGTGAASRAQLDYQSERHCSKTRSNFASVSPTLDYQSERHCSKTPRDARTCEDGLDYQSERHCSKTQEHRDG